MVLINCLYRISMTATIASVISATNLHVYP